MKKNKTLTVLKTLVGKSSGPIRPLHGSLAQFHFTRSNESPRKGNITVTENGNCNFSQVRHVHCLGGPVRNSTNVVDIE